MALVGGFGLGAWYVLDTVRQKQLANARSKRVASAPQATLAPRRVKARRRPTQEWLAGEDLLRYPARLSELETELQRSHRAAQEQLQSDAIRRAPQRSPRARSFHVVRRDARSPSARLESTSGAW